MAVDESILEAVGRRESPPTLRLYAWAPPCLSIGYAQRIDDVDLNRIYELGWDLVRRPTGGRAILHTDEVTYSVIGTPDQPLLRGGVLDSYNKISLALLRALELIGIRATAESKKTVLNTPPNNQEAICYEVPSNYEITVLGKKLIGSAQARQKKGVLQHGTFPLTGDLTRITQVLVYKNETERIAAATRLRSRATTFKDILNQDIRWDTAAEAIASGFENVYDLKLCRFKLTPQEIHRAKELVNKKYTDQQWTFKSSIAE